MTSGDKDDDILSRESEAGTAATALSSPAQPSLLWRKVTTLVCVGLLIIVWIMQACFIKSSDYQQWFFMVYFVHSLYAVFVPVWFILSRMRNKPIRSLNWPRICLITTVFAAIYLVCGVTWYISLPYTPVSANTAVTNCACTVVFILSVVFLHEKVYTKKVFSLVVSLAGVYLVYQFGRVKDTDDTNHHGSSFGYLLVTMSTVIYAVYQVLYGKYGDLYKARPSRPERTPLLVESDADVKEDAGLAKPTKSAEDDILNSMLFLGMMGVACLFLFWVLFPVFHYTGIEKFVLPTPHQWKMLIAMGTVATAFDILILICISLSSPFYVSIASMLSIPAGALADYLVYGYTLPLGSAMGVLCIVVGFAGLSL